MAMAERPRIPHWLAVVIAAAAYAVRSVIRGSAMPDLPEDTIVLGALLGLLALSALAGTAAHRRRDGLAQQMHDGDERGGGERQDDEVGADVQAAGTGRARPTHDGEPPA